MATIERLRRRPDFLAAAGGRRFHTERMTAQGRLRDAPLAAAEPGGLRLGLTVTKRVGCAPERNRIRRRLRAAILRVAADLPPDLSCLPADIVLIARRPALDAVFDALADDLRRAIPVVTRPRAPGSKAGTAKAGTRTRGRGRGKPPTEPSPAGGEPDLRAEKNGAPRPGPAPATPNPCCGVPDGQ